MAQRELAKYQTEQANMKVDETEKYQQELQSYKDSISMLVGEKSDFESQIKKLENTMKMKEGRTSHNFGHLKWDWLFE